MRKLFLITSITLTYSLFAQNDIDSLYFYSQKDNFIKAIKIAEKI